MSSAEYLAMLLGMGIAFKVVNLHQTRGAQGASSISLKVEQLYLGSDSLVSTFARSNTALYRLQNHGAKKGSTINNWNVKDDHTSVAKVVRTRSQQLTVLPLSILDTIWKYFNVMSVRTYLSTCCFMFGFCLSSSGNGTDEPN